MEEKTIVIIILFCILLCVAWFMGIHFSKKAPRKIVVVPIENSDEQVVIDMELPTSFTTNSKLKGACLQVCVNDVCNYGHTQFAVPVNRLNKRSVILGGSAYEYLNIEKSADALYRICRMYDIDADVLLTMEGGGGIKEMLKNLCELAGINDIISNALESIKEPLNDILNVYDQLTTNNNVKYTLISTALSFISAERKNLDKLTNFENEIIDLLKAVQNGSDKIVNKITNITKTIISINPAIIGIVTGTHKPCEAYKNNRDALMNKCKEIVIKCVKHNDGNIMFPVLLFVFLNLLGGNHNITGGSDILIINNKNLLPFILIMCTKFLELSDKNNTYTAIINAIRKICDILCKNNELNDTAVEEITESIYKCIKSIDEIAENNDEETILNKINSITNDVKDITSSITFDLEHK